VKVCVDSALVMLCATLATSTPPQPSSDAIDPFSVPEICSSRQLEFGVTVGRASRSLARRSLTHARRGLGAKDVLFPTNMCLEVPCVRLLESRSLFIFAGMVYQARGRRSAPPRPS
jgi:hypothetical protein